MLENITAVIFDLDGSLVDSMWMWSDIDIEYLGRYGKTPPKGLEKEIEGMGFSETAAYFKNRFSIPDSIETIKQDWLEMAYKKYADEVPLKPGALEFLKELKKRQIRLGIASSNSHDLIRACLGANHVLDYFDCIRTSCDVAKSKPEPDIYLSVAKELDAAPSECLVFEDVPMGILAGKRAGMKVCSVDDVFSAGQEAEKRALADYWIKSYDEILDGSYETIGE